MTKQEKIEQEPNMVERKPDNIGTALLRAQRNFGKAQKNAENSHFKNKYADLSSVLDAALPHLHAEGIYLSQPIETGDFGNAVRTILSHPASGTSLETLVPLLMAKQDMQAFKSASTYARRIGFENLTGLASGEDDDAEIERKTNTMGAALNDAWRQSVMDNLPANATPAQTAAAFADAICADFDGKGEKALQNRWMKHKSMIGNMEQRFPDLHTKVIDAFENAMMAATGNDVRRDV